MGSKQMQYRRTHLLNLATLLALTSAVVNSSWGAEKSEAQGLGVLLGVSSVFTALAPNTAQQDMDFCDRYLAQQPAAIYYGDFWRVHPDGRFSYDAAVKAQFQGVMYREDGKVITISQLRRSDAQKEVKLYLDSKSRLERLEYRFESGARGNSQVQTETHLFAHSGENCVPLERRDELTRIDASQPSPAGSARSKNVRYNLALCREIRKQISSDAQKLATPPINGLLAKSLRESFAKHDVMDKKSAKLMDDSLIASQALILLHECESTAGVREALLSAKAASQSDSGAL